MKRVFMAILWLLGAPSLWANALTASMNETAVPEHWPQAAIVGLEVQPARVELGQKFAAVQLLVTARLADGTTADVTRLATFTLPEAMAAVSATGQISAVSNGATTLTVAAGGQAATAPVTVSGQERALEVDFIRDVNPVMTKMGCNAGTCHGAKEGKLGFKLSLRGYDPLFDVRALKDDLAGRRLNVASPDDSLMLLKATAGVPHEGGQRTKLNEKYYEIMRAWIAHGAKLDPNAARVAKIEVFPKDPVVQEIGALQQTRIVATFADGGQRDVTAEAFVESGNTDVATAEGGGLFRTWRRGEAPLLARYEGNYAATTVTVMGDRSAFAWQPPETWGRVDELVAAKWERLKIAPSGLCDDADFLRRVSLDLIGLPPTPEEVRAFLVDEREPRVKRAEVIERMIGSPDYLEHWANKWCDLLQVNSKFLGKEGTEEFRKWIRAELEANTPYDEFVRKLIGAQGSTRENPAANYWKILRTPEDLVENTTHLFLATRFNCNKCHDHPFERWTQDQYYQLGAYFAQVDRQRDPESGAREIKGTAIDKAMPLFEIISDSKEGEMVHLRTNKPAAPEFPFAVASLETKPEETRREQLAAWLTAADNRYFAMSYANRLWGYLTGVGVIEPLDDIRAGNPPSNPELLEYLTQEFIGHHFDVRHLVRLICNSRTYQLSLTTNPWNEDDKINYAHATARRLPAEVLYDAVVRVTGSESRLPGMAAGTRAQQLPDSAIDLPSGFLAVLGRPARESACECERSSDIRLGSVMSLLSGPAVAEAIGDPKSELATLVQAQPDDAKLVDEIFMRVLNRPVRPEEAAPALAAWAKIGQQNEDLRRTWEEKEAEQKPAIEKMEAERGAATAATKVELARYEAEIAPRRAEEETKHQATVATEEAAMKVYEQTKLAPAEAAWEQSLPLERTYTGWHLFTTEIRAVAATGAAKLENLKDGQILDVEGTAVGTSDYTVQIDPKAKAITGLLVEALPDPSVPSFGPGTIAGNFVLTELTVDLSRKGSQPDAVRLKSATADFSQKDYEVIKAIDGNKEAIDNGWAVAPSFGRPHAAAFALAKPLTIPTGTRLVVKLFQQFPTLHLKRFRLWYTTDRHVGLGLPADLIAALKVAPEERSAEQKESVLAYFRLYDPEATQHTMQLAAARLPMVPDPGVTERRAAVAQAEEPVKLDPVLAQLRLDVEQSGPQAADRRLTGAQDLVWALINNPAFLFNH